MRILLVEDDTNLCTEYISYIDKFDDILLVGTTNNSSKAIDIIKDTYPDVIILDLELHNGSGNGLFVLKALKEMSLDLIPYILVTTNNSSATTLETTRKLGADFILSKHQDDFSVKNVIDFLQMIQPAISKAQHQTKNLSSPQETSKRLSTRINAELNFVGISPKVLGYTYLKDAILVALKEPQPNICTLLGNRYKKTESSVERAMQNAINRAWKSTDIDDLLLHYTAKINSEKGVPTVTEFIYYYANKLRNKYE
jgi:DNA-binding NarL/FixJ family response regulator